MAPPLAIAARIRVRVADEVRALVRGADPARDDDVVAVLTDIIWTTLYATTR
ncbi:hypothetical protein [Amycolatopsis sp. lyj-346]|uniref:hypothetical protein n=1 Tax=Amycolatopsis sp. lyj-346 TaxID=2789289 RepID=UPI00397CA98E